LQYTGLPSAGLKGTCVSFLQSAHVAGNICLSSVDMAFVAKCYIITIHSGFLDLYRMFAYVGLAWWDL